MNGYGHARLTSKCLKDLSAKCLNSLSTMKPKATGAPSIKVLKSCPSIHMNIVSYVLEDQTLGCAKPSPNGPKQIKYHVFIIMFTPKYRIIKFN